MYKYCPLCRTRLKIKAPHKGEPKRPSCPACSFIFYNNPAPTVTGLFLKKGKLLFSQRAINPFKNYWDLPGGFVEAFETPEKALKREMKEELNVKITKAIFFGVYIDRYFCNAKNQSTFNLYYLVEYQGRLKPKDDVKAIKWFSFNKPPKKIAFRHIYKVLKDLKNHEAKAN